MRVSTLQMSQLSLRTILERQSDLTKTQLQVSTGKRIISPSDDPVGTVRTLDLKRSIKENEQYQRNIDLADSRLQLEEQVIADAQTLLQRTREQAVMGLNASQTNETRSAIAKDVKEQLDALYQLANTQDSDENYIFAGFNGGTRPFSTSGGVAVYNGDQGQRLLQISASRTIADGDAGADVFMKIRSGNGTFVAEAGTANTGSGVLDEGSVIDPTAWDGDTYTITFTAANTYEVTDSGGAVVATGTHDDGDSIAFQGVEVGIDGTPAVGDTFTVSPSRYQDIFSSLEMMVSALETPVSDDESRAAQKNLIHNAMSGIDRAMDNLIQVRTEVGSRLNALESQRSINETSQLTMQELLSSVEDVDMAEAVTRLNQQVVGLDAAQQTYTTVQGLSLFRYL